jgi:lactate racemase
METTEQIHQGLPPRFVEKGGKILIAGLGGIDVTLSDTEVRGIIEEGVPAELFRGKRVLVLTPDATRTCPLPMMVRALHQVIGRQCRKLDFMVALGTHTPLSQERILALYGIQDRREEFSGSTFYNHDWHLEGTFHQVGSFGAGCDRPRFLSHHPEPLPPV